MAKALSQYARTGWTPECKRKHAAAIQRWRPWDQSTGPKTQVGKAASAKNGAWSRPLAWLMKQPSSTLIRFLRRVK